MSEEKLLLVFVDTDILGTASLCAMGQDGFSGGDILVEEIKFKDVSVLSFPSVLKNMGGKLC